MKSRDEQIIELDWQDNKKEIDFYESNGLYYSNYQRLKEDESISQVLQVKLIYAKALYKESYFDKVLKVLEDVSDILAQLGTNHPKYQEAETQRKFLLGMILGHKGKFKEAYLIFDELRKADPDHYYYNLWYYHAKLGLFNWIFNLVTVVAVILIFSDLIFELDKKISIDLGLIGLILLAVGYLTQKAVLEFFRRKKAAVRDDLR